MGGTCSRFISPGVCGLGDLPAMLIIGVATSELIFAKPVFPLELRRPDLSQKCTEAEQGSDYQSGTQLSSRASRENQHTTYNGRQNMEPYENCRKSLSPKTCTKAKRAPSKVPVLQIFVQLVEVLAKRG